MMSGLLAGWTIAYLVLSAATPGPASTAMPELADLRLPNVTMSNSLGKSASLSSLVGPKGFVLFFLSTECPLSNGYLPTINRLTKEMADKGIEIVGVNPNDGQGLKEIEFHRIRYGIVMNILRDPGARLANSLGVTHCPEVVVFNPTGKAVYRGRIDDRYPRRGGAPKQVFHQHDLDQVLREMLAGDVVDPRETEPVGCPVVIERPEAVSTSPDAPVTFTRDVASILFSNCVECHRPGGIGPFELTSYEQATLWCSDLVSFTKDGSMPPWKLVEGWGEFQHPRRLKKSDVETLEKWVTLGCPKGSDADMPKVPTFHEGWSMGTPDAILEMPEAYELAAEGPDEYRHFVIKTDFPEDVYIRALDILPGNPRVDHHVIVFLDPNGASERLDKADPLPGYVTSGGWPGFVAIAALGGWAPGIVPTPLPPGVARILPKGSRIVLQMHYHKSGRPEVDQTKIGLYFSKEKPKRLVRDIAVTPLSALPMLQNLPVVSKKIPANDGHYVIGETMVIPEDIDLISVRPHMHLIGKEMKLTAKMPDGRVEQLMYIKNWDFNWQENYYYAKPVRIPKDTKLTLESLFDNSEKNPANPSMPPKDVGWGEATTDEMAFCFMEVLPTKNAQSDEDLQLKAVTRFLKQFLQYQLTGPHTPFGQVMARQKGN
jgi:peroxiredoxin